MRYYWSAKLYTYERSQTGGRLMISKLGFAFVLKYLKSKKITVNEQPQNCGKSTSVPWKTGRAESFYVERTGHYRGDQRRRTMTCQCGIRRQRRLPDSPDSGVPVGMDRSHVSHVNNYRAFVLAWVY